MTENRHKLFQASYDFFGNHLARRLAQLVVPQAHVSYERPFRAVWFMVAVLILLWIAVLAVPTVVSAVLAGNFLPSFHSFLTTHHTWLERWCPSLELISEILTAIFLGHAVFSEPAAESIKKRLERLQNRLVTTSLTKMTDLERSVYRVNRTIQYLVFTATNQNALQRIPRLYLLFVKKALLIRDSLLGWSNTRFLFTAVFTSFQGGFTVWRPSSFLC